MRLYIYIINRLNILLKTQLTGAGAGAGRLKGINCGSAAYCCWRFRGR
jgi:hypothetical protein